MEAWRKLDIRKLNELREHIRKHGLSHFNKTIGSIVELRKDLKAVLDERLARMEKDIAEIKAKLGLL